jgi:hypothetical protein
MAAQPPSHGLKVNRLAKQTQQLDLDRLLKLRLVVARFGEMDVAKWWNTKGQLGKYGAGALRRGFPRTHYFAQARSVFAVAAHRCEQHFNPPQCVTLWQLPEGIEEEFESRWEHWLDNGKEWNQFFETLTAVQGGDLVGLLKDLVSMKDSELDNYGKLRRSNEGRSVPLPNVFAGTDQDIALLALGFARGEPTALAVPYAQRENE